MVRKIEKKIKDGKGTLIGNSGEYFVVAELLKQGIIAALAPRNAPAFDILATNGDKTVKIRVKTKSEQFDIWQWNIKKDGTIFKYLTNENDFTILVNLTKETKDQEYYIIPTHVLNKWLKDEFVKWVSTPGKRKPQRDPKNSKRHLNYPRFEEKLKEYKNWQLLWS